MPLETTIGSTHGYAGNSQNYCELWGGSKRAEKAAYYAKKLRQQWGIAYPNQSTGSMEIPFNKVRNPDDEWYIPCDDLQGIDSIASKEFKSAQGRLDGCGWSGRCKCRAKIDKEKWREIRDWAQAALAFQTSSGVDDCVVEEYQEANQEILDFAQKLLEEREGKGINNNIVLGTIALGTIASIVIVLKTVK